MRVNASWQTGGTLAGSLTVNGNFNAIGSSAAAYFYLNPTGGSIQGDANYTYFYQDSGNWHWRYQRSTGMMNYIRGGDWANLFQVDGGGSIWNPGSATSGNATTGRMRATNGVMSSNGLMYVADNDAYYFGRGGDGTWTITDGGVANLYYNGGNLTVNGRLACQSTGVCYSNVGAQGFNFRWDGANFFIRADNSVEWALQPWSDERVKGDIAPSTFDCLAAVQKMPLYQFRFRHAPDPAKALSAEVPEGAPLVPVGFIAQRADEAFPGSAFRGTEAGGSVGGATTFWQMDLNVVSAALCGAVKQLDARNAELADTVRQLSARLAQLEQGRP
jgi:hypothetical protein